MDRRVKLFFIMQAVILVFAISLLSLTIFAGGSSSATSADPTADAGGIAIGAGLAMGLAGAGAGIGLGTAGSAAIGAITEKPEVFGRTIIYVGLIEGVAVFGFVIAYLLMGRI